MLEKHMRMHLCVHVGRADVGHQLQRMRQRPRPRAVRPRRADGAEAGAWAASEEGQDAADSGEETEQEAGASDSVDREAERWARRVERRA